MTTLLVRLIEVDDRRAKAAIYGLNQTGRRPYELEEAWIVQALVREDGLSQLEVAELLGRHKSWVCRRLALLEKLCADVRQDLEVGLLTPTAAREIARLPAGNQSEVLDLSRREALNGDELGGVVRLLLGAVTAEQKMFVLAKPRRRWGRPARPSPRAGTPGSARAAIASASSWRSCWTDWRGWRTSWNVAAGRRWWRPIVWSWARSSRGSHATRSAWRTGPATWPWR